MTTESLWVPKACSLPTADQPLRVAEFDGLFSKALRRVDRPEAIRLRLTLDPEVESGARDLIARESECCSFFGIKVSRAAAELVIDIEVPAAQVAVLDAIATRAANTRGSA